MTQHRRHGMELRDGRWCSANDLERLRREAAEGSLADLKRYFRTQRRCGHGLEDDLPMVRHYILRRAQEAFPDARVVLLECQDIEVLLPSKARFKIAANKSRLDASGAWAPHRLATPHPDAPNLTGIELNLWNGFSQSLVSRTRTDLAGLDKWLTGQFRVIRWYK